MDLNFSFDTHSRPNTKRNERSPLMQNSYFAVLKNLREKNSHLLSQNKNCKKQPKFIEDLYLKYSSNLENYFSKNKNKITLYGSKCYENESIDTFLSQVKENKAKIIQKMRNKGLFYVSPGKNRGSNEKIILTPLPNKSRQNLVSTKEKEDFFNAERSAVVMRTVEYTHAVKADSLKNSTPDKKKVKVIQLNKSAKTTNEGEDTSRQMNDTMKELLKKPVDVIQTWWLNIKKKQNKNSVLLKSGNKSKENRTSQFSYKDEDNDKLTESLKVTVRNSQYKCMNIGFNLLAQFMIKKKVQIKRDAYRAIADSCVRRNENSLYNNSSIYSSGNFNVNKIITKNANILLKSTIKKRILISPCIINKENFIYQQKDLDITKIIFIQNLWRMHNFPKRNKKDSNFGLSSIKTINQNNSKFKTNNRDEEEVCDMLKSPLVVQSAYNEEIGFADNSSQINNTNHANSNIINQQINFDIINKNESVNKSGSDDSQNIQNLLYQNVIKTKQKVNDSPTESMLRKEYDFEIDNNNTSGNIIGSKFNTKNIDKDDDEHSEPLIRESLQRPTVGQIIDSVRNSNTKTPSNMISNEYYDDSQRKQSSNIQYIDEPYQTKSRYEPSEKIDDYDITSNQHNYIVSKSQKLSSKISEDNNNNSSSNVDMKYQSSSNLQSSEYASIENNKVKVSSSEINRDDSNERKVNPYSKKNLGIFKKEKKHSILSNGTAHNETVKDVNISNLNKTFEDGKKEDINLDNYLTNNEDNDSYYTMNYAYEDNSITEDRVCQSQMNLMHLALMNRREDNNAQSMYNKGIKQIVLRSSPMYINQSESNLQNEEEENEESEKDNNSKNSEKNTESNNHSIQNESEDENKEGDNINNSKLSTYKERENNYNNKDSNIQNEEEESNERGSIHNNTVPIIYNNIEEEEKRKESRNYTNSNLSENNKERDSHNNNTDSNIQNEEEEDNEENNNNNSNINDNNKERESNSNNNTVPNIKESENEEEENDSKEDDNNNNSNYSDIKKERDSNNIVDNKHNEESLKESIRTKSNNLSNLHIIDDNSIEVKNIANNYSQFVIQRVYSKQFNGKEHLLAIVTAYTENIIDLDSTKTSTYNSSSIQNIPYQKISYQSPVFITKTIYQNVTYQKQSLRSIQTHFKTSLRSKHKKELSYLSIFPIRKPELNIFNFSSSFYITKKRYPLPQVENIDTLSNENISKINYVEDTDKSLITDPNPFIISKNKSFDVSPKIRRQRESRIMQNPVSRSFLSKTPERFDYSPCRSDDGTLSNSSLSSRRNILRRILFNKKNKTFEIDTKQIERNLAYNTSKLNTLKFFTRKKMATVIRNILFDYLHDRFMDIKEYDKSKKLLFDLLYIRYIMLMNIYFNNWKNKNHSSIVYAKKKITEVNNSVVITRKKIIHLIEAISSFANKNFFYRLVIIYLIKSNVDINYNSIVSFLKKGFSYGYLFTLSNALKQNLTKNYFNIDHQHNFLNYMKKIKELNTQDNADIVGNCCNYFTIQTEPSERSRNKTYEEDEKEIMLTDEDLYEKMNKDKYSCQTHRTNRPGILVKKILLKK